MKKITLVAVTVVLLTPVSSWAHGFAGKRFFPTTLSTEDPFVSDELSFIFGYLKESGEGDEPPINSFELSGEYSKRITPHLGVSIGDDFRRLDLEGGEETEYGFGNLELGAKYQFFTNAPHEALLSVGVEAEIGDTGSRDVEAEPFSTISPAIFFGKGFGDLPESLKYLRPLAITGVIGPNFPTDSRTETTTIDGETREVEREVERNPITLSYGFAIEYSLQYLQSFVKDVGLGTPFDRMILLVEFPFETGLNRGSDGETTGFVNPGIIWFGKSIQLGIEAQIPINDRSGENVGILGIIHFFIDDLFPNSLGRPIFR
ncbi:MAG TPA: hypothetical protein VHT73_04525 [Thermodesulfobacteriota bacterium]|nr:hypothetical protein [Thermodesulfobacteriota bacterium]